VQFTNLTQRLLLYCNFSNINGQLRQIGAVCLDLQMMQIIINKLSDHLIDLHPNLLEIGILKALSCMMLLDEIDKFITMIPKLDDIPFQFQQLLLGELLNGTEQISVYHHLTIVEIEQFVK